MEKKEVVYSFSKLETFRECEMNYYLTYVKGIRDDDNNIYGEIGGFVHELLEDLQTDKITRERALELFEEKVDDCMMLGMSFATEKSGERYVVDIRHYLENYEKLDIQDFEMEEHFLIEIDGIKVRGFIDLWYRDEEGYLHVLDYKTSTKFAKKDLPDYSRQLILYAYALEVLGKGKVKTIGWDMLKYVAKPWRNSITLKERCELSDLDNYPRGILLTDYNEETKNEMLDYVKTTVKEINEKDVDNAYDWKPIPAHRGSFFCKTLCEHYREKRCIYHTYR